MLNQSLSSSIGTMPSPISWSTTAEAMIGFRWVSLLNSNFALEVLSKWMQRDGILQTACLESQRCVDILLVSVLYTITLPAIPRSLSNHVLQSPPPYIYTFICWQPNLLAALLLGASLMTGESVWQPIILNTDGPSAHLLPTVKAMIVD